MTRSSDVGLVCRPFWQFSARLGELLVAEAVDSGAVDSMFTDIRSWHLVNGRW